MTFAQYALDITHDSQRQSWVASANGTHAQGNDFPLQNLPLGIFSVGAGSVHVQPRAGVAIGDQILDLNSAVAAGLFTGAAVDAIYATADGNLNALMEQGHAASDALRLAVSTLLGAEPSPTSLAARTIASQILVPQADVRMHLPTRIGGFTDFMTSIDHVRRARSKLHPNDAVPVTLLHMPLAYNSRASSVRVSGHEVTRPNGQSRLADGSVTFGPCSALDFELELGAFVGPGNELGDVIALDDAPRHLFGYCLLNDWSARDIQRWESLPLGPFLGKSFCTVVSPWVVTAQALAPYACAPSPRNAGLPAPLAYLRSARNDSSGAIDLQLQAWISSQAMRERNLAPVRITDSRFVDMHWTFAQMLTHHASNGCDLQPGDLIGSGTVSGSQLTSCGCLAELSGPLTLPDGTERIWLADGDELIFKASARREGFASIGFGECRSRVLAARPWPGH